MPSPLQAYAIMKSTLAVMKNRVHGAKYVYQDTSADTAYEFGFKQVRCFGDGVRGRSPPKLRRSQRLLPARPYITVQKRVGTERLPVL